MPLLTEGAFKERLTVASPVNVTGDSPSDSNRKSTAAAIGIAGPGPPSAFMDCCFVVGPTNQPGILVHYDPKDETFVRRVPPCVNSFPTELALQQRPFDFDVCFQLFRRAVADNDVQKARKFCEHAASFCPTTETFWHEWIEFEKQNDKHDDKLIGQLFRRAVAAVPTAEMHLAHLRYLRSRHSAASLVPFAATPAPAATPTAPMEDDSAPQQQRPSVPKPVGGGSPVVTTSVVRRACEAALKDLGHHATEGPKIWAFYRHFEVQLLDQLLEETPQSEVEKSHIEAENSPSIEPMSSPLPLKNCQLKIHQQVDRIRGLFSRQFPLPLAGLPDLLDEYRIFEAELASTFALTPSQLTAIKQLHEVGAAAWELRKPYEGMILVGDEEADDDRIAALQRLSDGWSKYIAFEKSMPNPGTPFYAERVSATFMRACEDLGHIRQDLWHAWTHWLVSMVGDYSRAAGVYDRAVRLFPHELSLWLGYLKCQMRRSSLNVDYIRQVLFRGLRGVGSKDPAQALSLAFATVECLYSPVRTNGQHRPSQENFKVCSDHPVSEGGGSSQAPHLLAREIFRKVERHLMASLLREQSSRSRDGSLIQQIFGAFLTLWDRWLYFESSFSPTESGQFVDLVAGRILACHELQCLLNYITPFLSKVSEAKDCDPRTFNEVARLAADFLDLLFDSVVKPILSRETNESSQLPTHFPTTAVEWLNLVAAKKRFLRRLSEADGATNSEQQQALIEDLQLIYKLGLLCTDTERDRLEKDFQGFQEKIEMPSPASAITDEFEFSADLLPNRLPVRLKLLDATPSTAAATDSEATSSEHEEPPQHLCQQPNSVEIINVTLGQLKLKREKRRRRLSESDIEVFSDTSSESGGFTAIAPAPAPSAAAGASACLSNVPSNSACRKRRRSNASLGQLSSSSSTEGGGSPRLNATVSEGPPQNPGLASPHTTPIAEAPTSPPLLPGGSAVSQREPQVLVVDEIDYAGMASSVALPNISVSEPRVSGSVFREPPPRARSSSPAPPLTGVGRRQHQDMPSRSRFSRSENSKKRAINSSASDFEVGSTKVVIRQEEKHGTEPPSGKKRRAGESEGETLKLRRRAEDKDRASTQAAQTQAFVGKHFHQQRLVQQQQRQSCENGSEGPEVGTGEHTVSAKAFSKKGKPKVDVSLSSHALAELLKGQKEEVCTLHFTNLDQSITEEILRDKVLSKCKGIKEIRIVRDFRKLSKGFSYVDFNSQEEAEEALRLLTEGDPILLNERLVKVQKSKPTIPVYEPKTLFISGLPNNLPFRTSEASTTPEDAIKKALQEAFVKMSKDDSVMAIQEVRLGYTDDGTIKGYGYVEFETEDAAVKALGLPTESLEIECCGNQRFALAPSIPMKRHRWTIAPQNKVKKREERLKREQEKQIPSPEPATLFIKNLSFTTTEDTLKNFFDHDKIESVMICRDSTFGKSKGYGFVTFKKPEDAFASRFLDGTELDGREISVSQSHRVPTQPKPKPPPPPPREPKRPLMMKPRGKRLDLPSHALSVANLETADEPM